MKVLVCVTHCHPMFWVCFDLLILEMRYVPDFTMSVPIPHLFQISTTEAPVTFGRPSRPHRFWDEVGPFGLSSAHGSRLAPPIPAARSAPSSGVSSPNSQVSSKALYAC